MPRSKIPKDPNFPFHVTARVHNRSRFPLPLPEMWEIFQRRLYYLNRAFDFQILSFVMMPNHYHAIFMDPTLRRSEAMADLQRETAKEVNARANCRNQLWGSPYFCSLLTSTHYYLNCYKYIYQNPTRARLSDRVESYPFSTLKGLIGGSHLLIPTANDETLFSGFQETMSWLNQPIESENIRAMKHGLKNRIFSLPKDAKTKKAHPLEEKLI